MIKRCPIIRAYNVNMYCDKCGKVMKRSDIVLTTYPCTYTYNCECGHTETSTQLFPCQQLEYDTSNPEEVKDL